MTDSPFLPYLTVVIGAQAIGSGTQFTEIEISKLLPFIKQLPHFVLVGFHILRVSDSENEEEWSTEQSYIL